MPWLKLFPLLLALLSFLQPLAANASTLLLPLAAAESADVSAAHRDAVSFCRSTAKDSAAVEADYERAGRASFDGVLALFFGAQLRNGLNPSTATPAPATAVVEEVGALAEEAVSAAKEVETNARFISQPDGTLIDTQVTPRGSYRQPNGGRTDILQGEDHGAGLSHTHDPKVNVNPKTGQSFVNGLQKPGRPVSATDVQNIESGAASPAEPKGR